MPEGSERPTNERGRRVVGWVTVGVQFVLLAVLVALPWGSAWPRGAVSWTAGAALLATGVAVAVAGFAGLGPALTPTPVPTGSGLRTGGVYARIRHPIYTGIVAATLGWTVWAASWGHVVAWCALVVLLWAKSRWEESMLAQRYDGYQTYAEAAGRFLPRLRPR